MYIHHLYARIYRYLNSNHCKYHNSVNIQFYNHISSSFYFYFLNILLVYIPKLDVHFGYTRVCCVPRLVSGDFKKKTCNPYVYVFSMLNIINKLDAILNRMR